MADPIDGETVPSKKVAEKLSKILGCTGSHKVGDEWGPCPSREHLNYLIRHGSRKYREWAKEKDGKKTFARVDGDYVLVKGMRSMLTRYTRKADATAHAQRMGLKSVHRVGKYWAPGEDEKEFLSSIDHRIALARRRARRNNRGVMHTYGFSGIGISNAAGGGFVSAGA